MEENKEVVSNRITLVDEEGKEHEFNLLNIVEVEGKKYAVVAPILEGDGADEDEAVIFRIEKDEADEEVLVDIEDDAEFNAVCVFLDDLANQQEETDTES